MIRHGALVVGMVALLAGCRRERDRAPAVADTVSLAPLADSVASQPLDDADHLSRAGARGPAAAARAGGGDPTRSPEHHRATHPRKLATRSAPKDAAQGYVPSDDSAATALDTAAVRSLPAGSTPRGEGASRTADTSAAPDTSADARAAVGDSIIPSAIPSPTVGGPSGRSSPAGIPSASSEAAARPGVAANALPAGTQIRAILLDSINSLRNSVGQTVSAVVSGDLRAPDGLAVLPTGSVVRLTIERLRPARTRSAQDGELILHADSVTAGRTVYRIDAAVQAIPHELRGRGVTAGEVEKVGAGAAAGAVVGGVVSGKTKGAVIGGAVGAVGGAVVAAQTASRDVVVAPRTLIMLVLRSPVPRASP